MWGVETHSPETLFILWLAWGWVLTVGNPCLHHLQSSNSAEAALGPAADRAVSTGKCFSCFALSCTSWAELQLLGALEGCECVRGSHSCLCRQPGSAPAWLCASLHSHSSPRNTGELQELSSWLWCSYWVKLLCDLLGMRMLSLLWELLSEQELCFVCTSLGTEQSSWGTPSSSQVVLPSLGLMWSCFPLVEIHWHFSASPWHGFRIPCWLIHAVGWQGLMKWWCNTSVLPK